MTDIEAAVEPEIIVIGAAPKEESDHRWFLGNETLNDLNICFAVTTVAGLICGVLGTALGASVCMLLFLGYGFATYKRVPNMERFADSLYYQGFILTLFALLWAMTGKGAGQLSSDGIILQFGLALWTTFIGMGGRIFVIQFFTSAYDQDEQARVSISAYVEQLNKEISETLLELHKFREHVLTTTTKTTDDLVQEAKGHRKETAAAIDAAMKLLVKSMGDATTKLDASVGGVAEKISQLQIPTDVFSSQIRKVTDVMTADLERIRTDLQGNSTDFATMLKQNVSVLKQTEGDLGTLRRSLSEINKAIGDASATTAESLATAQRNLQAAQNAEAGVQRLGSTAEALAGQLGQLSGVFERRTKEFVADAEQDAKRVTDAFVDSARRITDAVNEVRRTNESSQ